jgi:pimeloyl-ACP methyl ester carboxylesterase
MGWHASEMHVPARDGTPIAVHDLGGDGPPLLLAHATGFHGQMWTDFGDLLARRFRLWSFDARGHGDSGKSDDMTWKTMGDDVLDVLDALGIDQLLGFGHSLGGALLVVAETARPGTFRQLYLYEPAIIPPMSPRNLEAAEGTLKRRRSFPTRKHAFENYAGKPPLDELSDSALWAYVEHGFVDQPDGTVTLACTPEDEAATFAEAGARTAWNAMDAVTCPVTLARGTGPAAASPGHIDSQAEHLRAEVVVFEGLGHFGPLAEPDAIAESITDAFLSR